MKQAHESTLMLIKTCKISLQGAFRTEKSASNHKVTMDKHAIHRSKIFKSIDSFLIPYECMYIYISQVQTFFQL